jgi:hypothetical protein
MSVRRLTVPPKIGAVSVLLVSVSLPASVDNVPVVGRVTLVAPVEVRVIELAPDVARVLLFAIVRTPEVVALIVSPLIVVAVAAPKAGVTKVGEVAKTRAPEPVSSDITPASSAEVVAANTDSLLAVYVTVPPVPKATEDESVPVKVKVLLAVKVFPSATARVEDVAGVVMAILLIEVAEATPSVGVTKVGEVLPTRDPVPLLCSQ